ncbi:hypothetical protein [Streptomyces sp. NBC_00539]|uniref:hypothetical protein n=1 Tax=Streptomyces sp. NBC_00539 TaxID=2975770 RepID=UPI002E81320E|nr:hypothetical protein [Streptomyces sp. NBC_00539]WUC68484.1 hypothetical protein OG861_32005 [Streptomyces sp. NBC_00539]
MLAGRDVLVRAVRLRWALGAQRSRNRRRGVPRRGRGRSSGLGRGDALRRHIGEEAAADYLYRLALTLAA